MMNPLNPDTKIPPLGQGWAGIDVLPKGLLTQARGRVRTSIVPYERLTTWLIHTFCIQHRDSSPEQTKGSCRLVLPVD